jgi:hypothetical protein
VSDLDAAFTAAPPRLRMCYVATYFAESLRHGRYGEQNCAGRRGRIRRSGHRSAWGVAGRTGSRPHATLFGVEDVQRLVDAYRSVVPSADAEDAGQLEIITELEDHVGDPRVIEFYLSVIADPAEYDLARIECIKILALYPPDAPADRQRVGRTVAQTLWPDEDYLVRQYAAMSLGPYAGDDAVFEALEHVLVHDDDIDVRFNALASVEEAARSDRTLSLLRRLADDPQLGSAAARSLREREEAPARAPE